MNYRTSDWRFTFRLAFVFLALLVPLPVLAQQLEIHDGRPAVSEEILVRLRSTDSAALGRARGAAPFSTMRSLSPGLALHVVRAPGNSISALLRAFSSHPDVLYAEPNYVVRADTTTPNDPWLASLWAMGRTDAGLAWDATTGSTSAVVGVVDTGIDYTHPDLAANMWSAPAPFSVTIQGVTVNCPAGSHGFNAITFSCDPGDDNNHGTHVAGTIGAAGNNATGVVGVNWKARMMGLKFMNANGSGTTSGAINAIEFAIQVKARFAGSATPVDVRVLSNSWSGEGFSRSLLDEIRKANANEILFVAAAGNSSSNNDQSAVYPSNFSTMSPNVISVAATDSSDTLAGFSNYGAASVHLGAPGVSIYSTVRNGNYSNFSGTSMATPHVAGAALLALAACPWLDTNALKTAILASVDSASSLQGRTVTGGRLNVNRTLRSCLPSNSQLRATFIDSTGEDRVGSASQTWPNGVADWKIQLNGLRGTPVKVTVSSAQGGIWEAPYNGINWAVVGEFNGENGNLWIEPWASPGFHVKVWYSDSTTDEADVATVSTSSFRATFLGTGDDRVGPVGQLTPSGNPDWRIRLEGLRGAPVKVRVSSAVGGIWESPYNLQNWTLLPQYDGAGNADLWFEPWETPGFHVQVWYSDGSSDQAGVQ